MLNLFFEALLTIYLLRNKEYLIIQLNTIYRGLKQNDMELILEVFNTGNFLINILQYTFGFYAVFSHRIINFKIFNGLMIFGMVFRIAMTYLNIMNILMLILKAVTFIYTRYVMTLLYSILLQNNI